MATKTYDAAMEVKLGVGARKYQLDPTPAVVSHRRIGAHFAP